ncbi:MAG TPA: ABC transporter ATP-binding protein [Syntrophorhabdaceae bacterium]|nr:ABC transporter ATP-binding protein [Syntrophorhabdaceae bacterium]
MEPVLRVEDLKTQFRTDNGLVKAVDGVSYDIYENEIVGIVGESGCGKSVTQLSVLQLIASPPGEIVSGRVMFEGKNLLDYSPTADEMYSIRGGKIAMIFQEPMTSLNPVLTVSRQMTEMLEVHLDRSKSAARMRAIELLRLVGIPAAQKRIDDYPYQFSGGMRQRVMIAMALSCNPKIIIADEPTTAVDVTTQAQLLELMKDMVNEFKTSLIIVTHNLGVVARYAQRIYVMYAGRIVEAGTTKDLFGSPCHPYTIGLLKSVPQLNEAPGQKLVPIKGMPPDLIDMPPTCAFLPRCEYYTKKCEERPWPDLRLVEGQHHVSCYADIRENRRDKR